MRTRKLKRIRKLKGGQRVRFDINHEWVKNLTRLASHDNDCGANTFMALGYTDYATSFYLSSLTPHGLHGSFVIALLDRAYGPAHYWATLTGIDNLHEFLEVGDATIGAVGDLYGGMWGGGTWGHYVVIYSTRSESKIGYNVFDIQNNVNMPLDAYLHSYNLDTFHIVSSPMVTREYNKIDIDMIQDIIINGRARMQLQESYQSAK